jgi:hypothetical protein
MTDIRPARISDASRPAQLSGVLGYPVSTDSMARRLGRVLARADDVIFVAGSPAGITEAVAWVGGWSLPSRRGQPRADWRMAVRSNVTRPESHPTYGRLGYVRVNTSHIYRKPIGNRA